MTGHDPDCALHGINPVSDAIRAECAPPRCPFCDKIAEGDFDLSMNGCVVFEPLNPVTPGHTLVVPIEHAPDAANDPNVGRAVDVAAALIKQRDIQANIITSVGPAATQSIRHTHIHVIPRREGDGLHLPWTNQKKEG